MDEPTMPGAYLGDLFYGDPENTTKATHRWNGNEWVPMSLAHTIEQEPIMQFFAWEHLPLHLQTVSQPFGLLARWIVNTLPRNPERTVALRKLLEAKDAAVRAKLFKEG